MSRRLALSALICAASILLATAGALAEETVTSDLVFEDAFQGSMQEGWSWIRPDGAGWRITDRALEIRVQPGNMWGGANDAKNVLVRPIPDANQAIIEVTVVVENAPTEQYEQVDLVWYFTDSHMVKIGLELVDGQLSVVMGREANDRTRTLGIIPVTDQRVALRLRVDGDEIQGSFRAGDDNPWTAAGRCELPKQANTAAKISIQAYQGPADQAHWARIQNLRIRHFTP